MLHPLEKLLYARGYTDPRTRNLAATTVAVCGVACVAVLLAMPFAGMLFSLAFVCAALLSLVNFLFLARFVQDLICAGRGSLLSHLVGLYGRLIVTGLVLYALLAWAHAPVVALIAGLSTTVAGLVVWGGVFVARHSRDVSISEAGKPSAQVQRQGGVRSHG